MRFRVSQADLLACVPQKKDIGGDVERRCGDLELLERWSCVNVRDAELRGYGDVERRCGG